MRLALLVDNETVDYHTFMLYKSLLGSEKIEDILIITQNKNSKRPVKREGIFFRLLNMIKEQGFQYLLYAFAYKFIITIERSRYKKLVGDDLYRKLLATYDLSQEPVTFIDIKPIKSKSGLFYRFEKKYIDIIKESNIDLLIRCGSGIYKGDILSCVQFGIISFHHGDNRKYRGGPAGFWEVLEGEEYTGFIIQKLTEDLDGGDVLMRGEFSTQNYYMANQLELWRKSTTFLFNILEKIAQSRSLPSPEECVPYSRKLYRYPKVSDLLSYILLVYCRVLIGKIASLKKVIYKENYFLLYAKLPNWTNLSFRRLEVVPPVLGRFFADPFAIKHKDDHYLFFEDYSINDGKGEISCMRLVNGRMGEYKKVLKSRHHLSFPFVFEHDDQVFMVPESIDSESVTLYRSCGFPDKWEKVEDLLHGIRAADPMIVYHNKKFWLFCNIDSNCEDDFSRELHIFYSDNLIDGVWESHKQNPLVNSPNGGRNGGVIVDKENLYRVGQISTIDTYGKSFTINKVVELSEQNYIENLIYEPNGLHNRNMRYTHHFSAIEGLAVLDGFGRWGQGIKMQKDNR